MTLKEIGQLNLVSYKEEILKLWKGRSRLF